MVKCLFFTTQRLADRIAPDDASFNASAGFVAFDAVLLHQATGGSTQSIWVIRQILPLNQAEKINKLSAKTAQIIQNGPEYWRKDVMTETSLMADIRNIFGKKLQSLLVHDFTIYWENYANETHFTRARLCKAQSTASRAITTTATHPTQYSGWSAGADKSAYHLAQRRHCSTVH